MAPDDTTPPEAGRPRATRVWRWASALVQALIVVLIGETGVQLELARQAEEQRALVLAHVAGVRARLETELNSTLYLSSGLVAFASARADLLDVDRVNDLLSALYKTGRNVRNIVIAPDNRVKWVYPLAGNERVIGLYYPDNPQQWPAVKRAIERRGTIVAGPVDLVQGGRGLVSRTPIFRADGQYWGLLSLVIDWDGLQQTAGIVADSADYQLAIRGRDVEGSRGAVFFGSEHVFAMRPVESQLELPGGSWTIAAIPAGGWSTPSLRVHALRLLYGVIAALIGWFAFRLIGEKQEREIAREALASLNSELETRIDARTAELRNANDELARLVQTLRKTQTDLVRSEKLAALGALVAGIAHELNTPVGNSLLAASTLTEQLRQLTRMDASLKRSEWNAALAHMQEASDIIQRSLGRASELISSFKQVATDRTTAQRRRFTLAGAIHDLAVTLQPSVRRTGVTIEEDAIADVKLDSYPGPLDQVLMNLIQNAVLHAYPGGGPGRIRLSATVEGSWVCIVVEDFGVGIPPENLSRVFDPFFTTRLGQGGTGLGLHIVHNIVTGTLGGEIDVQSEPGRGTRFLLRLPLHAPLQADATTDH
ncbi:ATP-binding protein [Niveibacterium sp.]|uniref:ATP-binding protein n=1 Tax=Niveibacterium sp. TaxID=2017444 RepID=UPI0035B48702